MINFTVEESESKQIPDDRLCLRCDKFDKYDDEGNRNPDNCAFWLCNDPASKCPHPFACHPREYYIWWGREG